MSLLTFQGDENIREIEEFLGDKLLEQIVDSSQGCLLTHITFQSPDGPVTVPVGTLIIQNFTGTFSPFFPFPPMRKKWCPVTQVHNLPNI